MKESKVFVPGRKISEYTKDEIDQILKGIKYKRKGFFDRIHVQYCQYEITKEWMDLNKEDDSSLFLNCSTCSKDLSPGDYRDGHYPYHHEYNACKEHKDDYSNSLNSDTDS